MVCGSSPRRQAAGGAFSQNLTNNFSCYFIITIALHLNNISDEYCSWQGQNYCPAPMTYTAVQNYSLDSSSKENFPYQLWPLGCPEIQLIW